MATIKYRKIPANDLLNLQDVDLRILDLALADMRDKVRSRQPRHSSVM